MTKTFPKVISIKRHDSIQTEQGFSLSEVLVGMLMISAFSATALQAFVSATAFKVKAQELSEANTWMQDDLEWVRFKANQLEPDATRCQAINATDGYAKKLRDDINESGQTSKNILRQSKIGQRPYLLKRDTTIREAAPYHVLELTYTVTRNNSSSDTAPRDDLPIPPVSQLYAEVVPDAFMACP